MEKVIKLTDANLIEDKLVSKDIVKRLSGGPKKTRIQMINHDTGEVLQDLSNKVVITGSILGATQAFGIGTPVVLPDYNRELGLENTLDYTVVEPKNNPIVCLFCIGDSGCGATQTDIYAADFVDRINPENDIIPFRYVDKDNDIDATLRKYYFGRKEMDNNKIGYYFKNFDTVPQLHLRFIDGTQITNELYNIDTKQVAECYVETRLRVSRTDFRDYFEQVSGWDKARISSLSLCYAWYDDSIDDYRWYQQIYPYTKLNFAVQWLVDQTVAIDFIYQIYY